MEEERQTPGVGIGKCWKMPETYPPQLGLFGNKKSLKKSKKGIDKLKKVC